MKDNSGYPNMPGVLGAIGHPGAVGPIGPTGRPPPQYFCPKHGNIGIWVFLFRNGSRIQHYCTRCLQELAIEYSDISISERVKLLDPVYPWTDELTKEDFEES